MNKFLMKINDFMQNRYGVDHFTIVLLVLNVTMALMAQLFYQSWLLYISVIPLVYTYFRIFSKNKVKRHQENILFLRFWYPFYTNLKTKFKHMKRSKSYRYYKCKKCGQKLRVPKGKGRLSIKCPKCQNEFIKST